MADRQAAGRAPRRAEEASLSPLLGGATFPLRHRLFRLAWQVCWRALGAWTPPPLQAWRRFLVRLFGGRIAPTARIYGGVRIWYPPNLTMGEHACLGEGVDCYCMDRIELGPHALISQRAVLCGGGHDVDDPAFPLLTGPIVIGRDAWIAAEAFVGPGVTVGEGAVLGARACAVRDLEPWSVYVGNPARLARKRRVPCGAK